MYGTELALSPATTKSSMRVQSRSRLVLHSRGEVDRPVLHADRRRADVRGSADAAAQARVAQAPGASRAPSPARRRGERRAGRRSSGWPRGLPAPCAASLRRPRRRLPRDGRRRVIEPDRRSGDDRPARRRACPRVRRMPTTAIDRDRDRGDVDGYRVRCPHSSTSRRSTTGVAASWSSASAAHPSPVCYRRERPRARARRSRSSPRSWWRRATWPSGSCTCGSPRATCSSTTRAVRASSGSAPSVRLERACAERASLLRGPCGPRRPDRGGRCGARATRGASPSARDHRSRALDARPFVPCEAELERRLFAAATPMPRPASRCGPPTASPARDAPPGDRAVLDHVATSADRRTRRRRRDQAAGLAELGCNSRGVVAEHRRVARPRSAAPFVGVSRATAATTRGAGHRRADWSAGRARALLTAGAAIRPTGAEPPTGAIRRSPLTAPPSAGGRESDLRAPEPARRRGVVADDDAVDGGVGAARDRGRALRVARPRLPRVGRPAGVGDRGARCSR